MESRRFELAGKENRKNHNEDVIKRLRRGEPLCRVDAASTWFPPRPILSKDPEAMKRLYGEQNTNPEVNAPARVLTLPHHRRETPGNDETK
jgi:hypothetical protein